MFLPLVAVLLGAQSCLTFKEDQSFDIYPYVLSSLQELESRRASDQHAPSIQRASSVCYDELGCFDKEGTFKHLKQLPDPPESVNTQFLLYTRKNKDVPQILNYKKPESILKSNINPSKPLKIMTHGFGGKNNMTWIMGLKDAFLQIEENNVIIIDWSLGARVPYYIAAAVNTELVGAQAAVLYYFIKDNLGIQEKDLHLVGFSLGAHVVGFIGKKMNETRGTKPSRITGLDPASPLFEDYGGSVHLYKDDADFVDIVHTNADLLLYGGVGIGKVLGHVDFYPNGGKRQPGCPSTLGGALNDIFGGHDKACNHERAVHLYTETLLNPQGCEYVGYPCDSYSDFEQGKCMSCETCGRMGYDVKGSGIYYLLTKEKKPFCADLGKLTVRFPHNIKKTFGSIILNLNYGEDNENVTVTSSTDEKLLPGDEKVLSVALSKNLKSVQAFYRRYKGLIVRGEMTFGLASVTIENSKGELIFKSCKEVILKHKEYQPLTETEDC